MMTAVITTIIDWLSKDLNNATQCCERKMKIDLCYDNMYEYITS